MGRRLVAVTGALAAGVSLLGVTGRAGAAAPRPLTKAVIVGTITNAPSGFRLLAETSRGSSAYSDIAGNGAFSITLPTTTATTRTFTLHVVSGSRSYAGPITFGKSVTSRGKTSTTWYGSLTVNAAAGSGVTTTLPTITFQPYNTRTKEGGYGTATASGATAYTFTGLLRNASAAGKPAAAGRLGLAATRARSARSVNGWARILQQSNGLVAAANPGNDLDADGMPNSLDTDDDGDGYSDAIDPSAGSKGAIPTAQFDTAGSFGAGMDAMRGRLYAPTNYNFMRTLYPNVDDMKAEISQRMSTNYVLNIRAVAPFLNSATAATDQEIKMSTIKAAWVDCTGLAWCLASDTGSGDNTIAAPRMLPSGDGDTYRMWIWAYAKSRGVSCSPYQGDDCGPMPLWSGFTMKNFLQRAFDNGSPDVTQSVVGSVANQPDGFSGFGLLDPYVLHPAEGNGKNPNSAGFDLAARLNPGLGAKFLDFMKTGDVFNVGAIMSDGTTASIPMTIGSIMITTPAITSFKPAGGSVQNVDYTVPDPDCNSDYINGDDCRPGSIPKRIKVSPTNAGLDVTFWRPQRLAVAGTDDALAQGDAMVDMGGLDYSVQIRNTNGPGYWVCGNSALRFVSNGLAAGETGTWTRLDKPVNGYSNDADYYTDNSPDGRASAGRTVTMTVDFTKCKDQSNNVLPRNSSSTVYMLLLSANSQPIFGGNRGGSTQSFNFYFGT